MPSKIDLIAFDLDHTLCHPTRSFEAVFRDVFGLALDQVAVAWKDAITLDAPCSGEEAIASVFHAVGRRPSPAEMQEAFKRKAQLWASAQSLYPGVRDFLTAMRAQFAGRLIIITNGPSAFQHAVVRSLGLDALVDAVYASGDAELGRRKPNLECFRTIERIEGRASDRCLMIGDSLENDIAGARGAGWRSLWVEPQAAGEGFGSRSPLHLLQLASQAGEVPQRQRIYWADWTAAR